MPAQTDRQKAIMNEIKVAWGRAFMLLNAWSANQPQCNDLMNKPTEERADFVRTNWGDQALVKLGPVLTRVETLEKELDSI